eukprot:3669596-Pleurochrysis_carterae.AAC.4
MDAMLVAVHAGAAARLEKIRKIQWKLLRICEGTAMVSAPRPKGAQRRRGEATEPGMPDQAAGHPT